MNATGALLRRSSEFLLRNPVVLLPVFVARIADFLIYAVCALLKAPAMKAVAPRSVLGGFSGKVNGPLLLTAGFFTFLPLICEVALLVYAMVVSGRWAHAIRETGGAAEKSWRAPAGDVARVSALTLGVGAITATVGLYFTLHGGVPVRWSYLVTWCFLLLASWFVLPAWLRVLARVQEVRFRDPSKLPPFVAVVLGLIGYAMCVWLGGFVQHRMEVAHRIHGAVLPIAINLAAACLSVVPLGFCYVAMSRYVADRPGWPVE